MDSVAHASGGIAYNHRMDFLSISHHHHPDICRTAITGDDLEHSGAIRIHGVGAFGGPPVPYETSVKNAKVQLSQIEPYNSLRSTYISVAGAVGDNILPPVLGAMAIESFSRRLNLRSRPLYVRRIDV